MYLELLLNIYRELYVLIDQPGYYSELYKRNTAKCYFPIHLQRPNLTKHNRAFRHTVWSSFVFANRNCHWSKQIMWFNLTNGSYCLQKQMRNELHVERLYRFNLRSCIGAARSSFLIQFSAVFGYCWL